ncbi:MAG: hypothetical protein JW717_10755 [Marinilabiliaceae bacterium]|nr:hypothetical protein [Marinilabiliaceae bacterium]
MRYNNATMHELHQASKQRVSKNGCRQTNPFYTYQSLPGTFSHLEPQSIYQPGNHIKN